MQEIHADVFSARLKATIRPGYRQPLQRVSFSIPCWPPVFVVIPVPPKIFRAGTQQQRHLSGKHFYLFRFDVPQRHVVFFGI
jgi:hypothetical protein